MSDINKVIDALNKKHFHAVYAKDAAEAKAHVLSLISKEDTVGVGGSVTLDETEILGAIVDRGNTVYSSLLAKQRGEDANQAKLDGMTADVYLSSTNAVTLAGDLINIDGVGNRVAGMFFGPQKVIIVAGRNKITGNPNTAVARIKKVACPQNAVRLGRSTPCALTGKCGECDSEERMCNVVVRIQYPTVGKEMHVILIDEDYGY